MLHCSLFSVSPRLHLGNFEMAVLWWMVVVLLSTLQLRLNLSTTSAQLNQPAEPGYQSRDGWCCRSELRHMSFLIEGSCN
jgi:hypothetical protein